VVLPTKDQVMSRHPKEHILEFLPRQHGGSTMNTCAPSSAKGPSATGAASAKKRGRPVKAKLNTWKG
jgi:hypothetical protein